MPHHAATVHIFFHTAVLDLFRPFPYQRIQTPFSLDKFAADNPTPEGVCDASINQLKHLILIFRSKYPCATSSMLWQNVLLYVANACLPLQRGPLPNLAGAVGSNEDQMEGVTPTTPGAMEDSNPEDGEIAESEEDIDRRKWFTAYIDALRALAPQFGIVTGIVQGILSMAILKGSMPEIKGRAIMDQLKADAEVSSHHRRAHFSPHHTPGGGGGGVTPAAVVDGGYEGEEEDEEGGVAGGLDGNVSCELV